MSNRPEYPHSLAANRLYGRAKGRPLSPLQSSLMETVYKTVEIGDVPLAGLDGFREYWFEIGFGGSEHLIWQAQNNPDIAVLGAEPFINGMAKAVTSVDAHGLENVRLWNGDGRDILNRLPDACLHRVFVLFPDPWPKARHNKRRIISDDFLTELYRVMRPGGHFRFASDIIHYVDWSLMRILKQGGFSWPAQTQSDWRTRSPDWPPTRYEAKAIREGRSCHYFEFIRDGRPVKK